MVALDLHRSAHEGCVSAVRSIEDSKRLVERERCHHIGRVGLAGCNPCDHPALNDSMAGDLAVWTPGYCVLENCRGITC